MSTSQNQGDPGHNLLGNSSEGSSNVTTVLSRDGPASNLTFWHDFLPLTFLSSNIYMVTYPI